MTYLKEYASLWERTDQATRRAGVVWYPTAAREVTEGLDVEPERAAAIAAHLSPRVAWEVCVDATRRLVTTGERHPWIMTGPWSRALRALQASDPLSTFSRNAVKTEPFARALAGDVEACVIDTHMIHAGMGLRVGYSHLSTAEYRRLFQVAREALRALSVDLGEPVTHVQAALWLQWKTEKTEMEVVDGR